MTNAHLAGCSPVKQEQNLVLYKDLIMSVYFWLKGNMVSQDFPDEQSASESKNKLNWRTYDA